MPDDTKNKSKKPVEDNLPEDEVAESVEADTAETADPEEAPAEAEHTTEPEQPKQNGFKRCLHWFATHKKVSIPLAIIVLAGVAALIPQTRYALAGTVLKQSFPVVVVDAETNKPVSSVTLTLDGKKTTTNNEGRATIRTNVGYAKLAASKKYYAGFAKEVLVPIGKPGALKVSLQAEGRPVPVTVINKISKKAVANATVAADETKVTTDKDGKATIVLPADKKEVKVTVAGESLYTIETTLIVTSDEVTANTFELTPHGAVYFLSNASGKIDLVKSKLDGTGREVILAGTGKEIQTNTILLASRDWSYIALLSRRDGGEHDKLFLIETGSNKVTVMDEGEATFSVHGWSGDRFVYSVSRTKLQAWEPKRQALKSYHAPAKKITTLAETTAEGNSASYIHEYFERTYVLGQEIVFAKSWTWNNYPNYQSKKATLSSVKADGTQKKTVKTFPEYFVSTWAAEFGEIYISYPENGATKLEEYHNGKIEKTTLTAEEFHNNNYPRYAVSPTGKKTLWSEQRDGKNVFFVGDAEGANGKQIGTSADFTVYGWYTDEYVLLTKKDSEMYILPASGIDGDIESALKISDYYKSRYNNHSFGYSYGG